MEKLLLAQAHLNVSDQVDLIALHFSKQPKARIRSNMIYGGSLKPNRESTLEEAALGGSEVPITRSIQAEADFALVHAGGQVGLENLLGGRLVLPLMDKKEVV